MYKVLTAEQKKLLIARKQYIDFLDKNRDAIILGTKGTGKTTILKQYAEKKESIYINLSRLSISPENFAVEYIGNILYSIDEAKPGQYLQYTDIEFLAEQKFSDKINDTIKKVRNELQKIKPDQSLLLNLAFSFPKTAAIKHAILIDEFQELLALNNYSQVSDVLNIFLRNIGGQNTPYKLTSSSVTLLSGLLDRKVPSKELAMLDRRDVKDICTKVAKLLDYNVSDAETAQLHTYSGGHPLVLTALLKQLKNTKDVKKALIKELTNESSPTYSHLKEVYNNSLNNARGATLLKNILKVISLNENLRLTQIARKIYRSSPVTKALLERLIEVDLIEKEGNIFHFKSLLLKQWCASYFSGIQDEKLIGGLE